MNLIYPDVQTARQLLCVLDGVRAALLACQPEATTVSPEIIERLNQTIETRPQVRFVERNPQNRNPLWLEKETDTLCIVIDEIFDGPSLIGKILHELVHHEQLVENPSKFCQYYDTVAVRAQALRIHPVAFERFCSKYEIVACAFSEAFEGLTRQTRGGRYSDGSLSQHGIGPRCRARIRSAFETYLRLYCAEMPKRVPELLAPTFPY